MNLIRKEAYHNSDIFYVTSWGYAADHLFGWFPKALNSHPELFALLAHEGSRPKYLRERTRGERPDIIKFSEFLSDMAKTYSCIGDCYSYRAHMLKDLQNNSLFSSTPTLNLMRNPVTWINFFVRWRASNMRMKSGSTEPLEWEWKICRQEYFESLNLKKFDKGDISTWAFLQALSALNQLPSELSTGIKTTSIESIAEDQKLFSEIVSYLSQSKVIFSKVQLDEAYLLLDTLFRGEERVETDPYCLFDSWSDWQLDAFSKIVKKDTIDAFKSLGYEINFLEKLTFSFSQNIEIKNKKIKPSEKLFISTPRKAGTWAIREIITEITGLNFLEPNLEGDRNYGDLNLISWNENTYFSWHSLITKDISSLLMSSQAKSIFTVRNIYDIVFSFYNHFVENVDANIGRPTDNFEFLKSLPYEECITILITGYFIPSTGEGFKGIRCELERIKSYFDYIENGGNAIIIDFDNLMGLEKKNTIQQIIKFLEIECETEVIEKLVSNKIEINFQKPSHKNNIHKMRLKESINSCHIALIDNIFKEVFKNYDLNNIYKRFNLKPLTSGHNLGNTYLNKQPLNKEFLLKEQLMDKVPEKESLNNKIIEKIKKTYKLLDFIHE